MLPCLDEAETLATCITKAQRSMRDLGVDGEVIVADNGSTDGSQDIAAPTSAPASSRSPSQGYGSALLAGIAGRRGQFVLMADADDSYDLGEPRPVRRRSARRRRPRDGKSLPGRDRSRGDAVAAPIRRQPGPLVARPSLLPKPEPDFHCGIRAFRRRASSGSVCARLAWSSRARWS